MVPWVALRVVQQEVSNMAQGNIWGPAIVDQQAQNIQGVSTVAAPAQDKWWTELAAKGVSAAGGKFFDYLTVPTDTGEVVQGEHIGALTILLPKSGSNF